MTAPTPSQTIGPFLHIGISDSFGAELVPAGTPGAIRLHGRVLDGAGEGVLDAVVELWQDGVGLRPLRYPGRWAIRLRRRQAGACALLRGGGVRAGAPEACRDPSLLPDAPADAGALGSRSGPSRDSRRRRRAGRLAPVRHPAPGRRRDGVLRAMTFDAIFVPAALRAAVSDRAWFEAMLEAERALANAEAIVGVIPAHLAGPIAEACVVERFDVEAIVASGRSAGNPAEPLVRALRAAVGGEAAEFVHFGATSQDIVDTAAMLVSRRAVELILEELDGLAAACAALAEAHRETPMAARTLLRQAVPTTFGLKAAGWLAAIMTAREHVWGVTAPGAARRRGRDARGARAGRARRLAAVRGGARSLRARAAVAFRPFPRGGARLGARGRGGRLREDRPRRGAARADGGGRGARAGGCRRLLDDAAEAQSGRIGDRLGMRAAGRRGLGRSRRRASRGARAVGRCLARRMGRALGGADVRRRGGRLRCARCSKGSRSTQPGCGRTSTSTGVR